jgi:hypothetical protein
MTQLSEQVIISLENAQADLREALGFASKSEEPLINISISQILHATDEVLKHYEKRKISFDDVLRQRFGNI